MLLVLEASTAGSILVSCCSSFFFLFSLVTKSKKKERKSMGWCWGSSENDSVWGWLIGAAGRHASSCTLVQICRCIFIKCIGYILPVWGKLHLTCLVVPSNSSPYEFLPVLFLSSSLFCSGLSAASNQLVSLTMRPQE